MFLIAALDIFDSAAQKTASQWETSEFTPQQLLSVLTLRPQNAFLKVILRLILASFTVSVFRSYVALRVWELSWVLGGKKFFGKRQKMTSNGGFPVSVFALFLCVSVEKTIECHQSVTQDLKGLFTSMKQALIYNGKKSKKTKSAWSQQHPALEVITELIKMAIKS